MQSSQLKNQSIENTPQDEESKYKALNASNHSSIKNNLANAQSSQNEGIPINPLDVNLNDNTIDSENWVCAAGHYEHKRIVWVVPQLEEFNPDNLQFNIDVALNGQQFTGHPLNFRYYDVRITEIQPPLGPTEGGTVLRFKGTGLYDSTIKKIKFSIGKNSKTISANWERKDKSIYCTVPPLTKLFKNKELSEEEVQEIASSGVKISVTFNNQEWAEVPEFKYHDIKVGRLSYVTAFAEEVETEEEKEKLWRSEEPIEQPPSEATEEELKKIEEEKLKKIADETEEVHTVAKRIDAKMYIYGDNFINTGANLKLKFIIDNKEILIDPIFKNSKKLAWNVPDMGEEIEVGQHQVAIEVSVNGQTFTSNGEYFMYNAIDRNMSEEELKKLQDAEEKAKGKGGKKK